MTKKLARARRSAAPKIIIPKSSAIVLEEHGDVLRLIFEGHGVDFYTWRGRRCVIASEYGRAMMYAGDGAGLAEQVTGVWADDFTKGHHFDVIEAEELSEFKEMLALTGKNPVSANARHLTILYEPGADLAGILTRQPAGKALRRALVEHVIPKLRRGESVSLKGTVADRTLLTAIESMAERVTALLDDERARRQDVQAKAAERQGRLEEELDALKGVVEPYTAHPERFAPYNDLRDAWQKCQELKDRIQAVAKLHRCTFSTVEGYVRRHFAVSGYRRIRAAQFDMAFGLVDSFLKGLPPRVRAEPSAPANPRQMVMGFASPAKPARAGLVRLPLPKKRH